MQMMFHFSMGRTRLALRGFPEHHEDDLLDCQGIRGGLTVDNLLEQNRLHTPNIVMLLATKNRSHRYAYLKGKLGMEFMHAIEPKGIGGELCVFEKLSPGDVSGICKLFH